MQLRVARLDANHRQTDMEIADHLRDGVAPQHAVAAATIFPRGMHRAAREPGAHKGQYRLNKQDVSKGSAFEGEIMMLGTFATEAGTDVFDDTTIEAQPSGSHQLARRSQVGTDALEGAYRQLRGMEDALDDGLTQHLDGSGKTNAAGGQ